MGKKVVITADLVDESVGSSNSVIAEDLLRWFREDVLPAPWVSEIRAVAVSEL